MTGKKPKRGALAQMDFGEALARYIQTRPEEVRPPPGRKRKKAKVKRDASVQPSFSPEEAG
jgi:hypothetical protein